MDPFNQLLLDRQNQQREDRARAQRATLSGTEWMDGKKTPEERLFKFDIWVRNQLHEKIDWTWAGDQKARRIEQCRVKLEAIVLGLWRRGWMLDGRILAAHLVKMLDSVALYQRTGKLQDFWAYFSAAADRYVGSNAEELKAEAMRAGSHLSQVLGQLGNAGGLSLPELAAKRAGEVSDDRTIREKLAGERKRAKDKDQLSFL